MPSLIQDYIDEQEVSQNQLTYLEELLYQPLNLNQCTYEDLLQLPFVTSSDVKAIIAYRDSKGFFRSIYELQAIQKLKPSTINLLKSFVFVGQKLSLQKVLKQQLGLFYQNQLPEQIEYVNMDYVGKKYKTCIRYKGEKKHLNWGLLSEKDAGENLWDFNSLFLQYTDQKTHFIIGDYQLSLGQGLLHHQGFSFGKSSNVLGTFKNNKTIRPHTSSRESHFMRGIALSKQFEKLKVWSWYSYLSLDASLNHDTQLINTIYDSGLHRTTTEIANRNRLHQHSAGAKIKFTTNNFRSSFYSIANFWNKNIELGLDTLEKHWGIGYDYSITIKNTHFFGELSYLNHSMALLSGLRIQLDSRLAFSSIYRNYFWNYYALESIAFGEQSNVRNEQGFYAAMQMDINSSWKWSCYADFFRYPKPSYYSYSPLIGRDYLVQINHNINKSFNSYLRFQWENKTIETNQGVGLAQIENQAQLKIQFQSKYNISNYIFKNRIVWNRVEKENGYLFLQDLAYKPFDSKWSFTLRYVLFDTPSYSSRIYAYEPDVLYSFSVPLHYGEGQRYVALISYKMKSRVTVNFKYAQSQFFDLRPIKGDIVEGNHLTEFKIVLKLML